MKHLVVSILSALLFCLSSTAQQAPDYSEYILTPKAPDTPRINGPKVYGAHPGAEFLKTGKDIRLSVRAFLKYFRTVHLPGL